MRRLLLLALTLLGGVSISFSLPPPRAELEEVYNEQSGYIDFVLSKSSLVRVNDEGVFQGNVSSMNCTGTGIGCTVSDGQVTINITATPGGGGGASSLAVGTGSIVAMQIVSSPTAIISFSTPIFIVRLTGDSTAFVTVNFASITANGDISPTITAFSAGLSTAGTAVAAFSLGLTTAGTAVVAFSVGLSTVGTAVVAFSAGLSTVGTAVTAFSAGLSTAGTAVAAFSLGLTTTGTQLASLPTTYIQNQIASIQQSSYSILIASAQRVYVTTITYNDGLTSTGPVTQWGTGILGMPSGFSDGVDNTAAGASASLSNPATGPFSMNGFPISSMSSAAINAGGLLAMGSGSTFTHVDPNGNIRIGNSGGLYPLHLASSYTAADISTFTLTWTTTVTALYITFTSSIALNVSKDRMLQFNGDGISTSAFSWRGPIQSSIVSSGPAVGLTFMGAAAPGGQITAKIWVDNAGANDCQKQGSVEAMGGGQPYNSVAQNLQTNYGWKWNSCGVDDVPRNITRVDLVIWPRVTATNQKHQGDSKIEVWGRIDP